MIAGKLITSALSESAVPEGRMAVAVSGLGFACAESSIAASRGWVNHTFTEMLSAARQDGIEVDGTGFTAIVELSSRQWRSESEATKADR